MKGTGAKCNVCPGSCVSTGAKFPVAPVESAPMGECGTRPPVEKSGGTPSARVPAPLHHWFIIPVLSLNDLFIFRPHCQHVILGAVSCYRCCK